MKKCSCQSFEWNATATWRNCWRYWRVIFSSQIHFLSTAVAPFNFVFRNLVFISVLYNPTFSEWSCIFNSSLFSADEMKLLALWYGLKTSNYITRMQNWNRILTEGQPSPHSSIFLMLLQKFYLPSSHLIHLLLYFYYFIAQLLSPRDYV